MAEKVFLSDNKQATFVCPECKKSRTVDISKYKNLVNAAKIKCKCPCGHSYSVILEKRRYFRKETNLSGVYIYKVPGSGTVACEEVEKGILHVLDISRSGLKIKLHLERKFQVGDILTVEFRLDDQQRSLVRKEAIIRRCSGQHLGVEFTTKDPHFDKVLGFYLFN
jgi:hypothetical protein